MTLGEEDPLNGRVTELCEKPNAGECGPTLARDVFVTNCGEWDKWLGTGLGPIGVIAGFHVLVPPLKPKTIGFFKNIFKYLDNYFIIHLYIDICIINTVNKNMMIKSSTSGSKK